MVMIRKQLYIEPEQQRKLRSLAAQWGCTEAEVVRTALERLPDPDSAAEARLREAGILMDPPDDVPLLSAEELEALEQEHAAWLQRRGKPIGLLEALEHDRADRV